MSKTLHLISLGCTKNLVDSEVMLGRLRHYDLTDDASCADLILINTCGFIDAAKSESVNTILEAHELRKKGSLLVVTGCLSERYREELAAELPEVDLFTGVGDYHQIDSLIASRSGQFTPQVFLQDHEERLITGSSSHAYIKISEGCNQVCSFCAIPSFKGKLHSRTLESIVKEVNRLVEQGFVDFTFISQDSSSYGRDLGIVDGLLGLIDAIENIEGIVSARILYLYPSTTSLTLIDRLADSPVFQTYYDIPIQHISSSMLKTMKRGVGQDVHVKLLERMKERGGFVRTGVISGHPGESEADHQEMLAFLERYGFDRVSVFAYSDEEGTAAYGMEEKIPEETMTKRVDELERVAEACMERSLDKMVGQEVDLLLEGESEEHEYLLSARPIAWAPEIDGEVLVNESEGEVEYGKTYRAQITERLGKQLIARLITRAA